MGSVSQPRAKVVILGGGPGGYEAALVAAQVGAEVTVVERDGLGGACVLSDCVPSKTLIATSGLMAALDGSARLGIRLDGMAPAAVRPAAAAPARRTGRAAVDAPRLYARVRELAGAQSADATYRRPRERGAGRDGAADRPANRHRRRPQLSADIGDRYRRLAADLGASRTVIAPAASFSRPGAARRAVVVGSKLAPSSPRYRCSLAGHAGLVAGPPWPRTRTPRWWVEEVPGGGATVLSPVRRGQAHRGRRAVLLADGWTAWPHCLSSGWCRAPAASAWSRLGSCWTARLRPGRLHRGPRRQRYAVYARPAS